MFLLNDGMLRAMGAAGPARSNLWEERRGPDGQFIDAVEDGVAEGAELADVTDMAALEVVSERYPAMLGLMAERLAAGVSPEGVATETWDRLFEGEAGAGTDKSWWMLLMVSACHGQLRQWKEATG